MGGNQSGVYKIDLNNEVLSHPLTGKNPINDLKLSHDDKYLGLVETIPGESIVKIYYLNYKILTLC